MVKYYNEPLDATFMALADPTRRAILLRLTQGSATVSELAEPFSISLAATSKHLRFLEKAHLIRRERKGREHHVSLNAGPLQEAGDWINHYRKFWGQQLDALADYLEQQSSREINDQ